MDYFYFLYTGKLTGDFNHITFELNNYTILYDINLVVYNFYFFFII